MSVSSRPHIGLIVTGKQCLNDFTIFCRTLEEHHPNAVLYIATDTATAQSIVDTPFKGEKKIQISLDDYKGLNRRTMEAMPGKVYKTLWTDFMYEKANVLEWMFHEGREGKGAWFLDADITLLAPLPHIPQEKILALSPHMIRKEDEAKYGRYNGGFLWFADSSLLHLWRMAGETSRFFEQASLEVIARAARLENELYEFPIQVNFGWWRMFQSDSPPHAITKKFEIIKGSLSYEGQPLQSVHTHWYPEVDRITAQFNLFLLLRLQDSGNERILNIIQHEHRWLL